jgi:hypothetical protein
MNWRASVFESPLRGEEAETAGVDLADCVLGPQSDDFCEDAMLKVCQRCWFSSFYCFLPPFSDAHSHEWSIGRDVSPAVVWRGIFCECTASVGRWAIMGPLLGAYLLMIKAVAGPMGTPFSQASPHAQYKGRWWGRKWLKHACGDVGWSEWAPASDVPLFGVHGASMAACSGQGHSHKGPQVYPVA